MRKANIVIMGKTGAGKSTIVNAVVGRDVTDTGEGLSVTCENAVYDTYYQPQGGSTQGGAYKLSLYDTVGLELDREKTIKTLAGLREQIEKSQANVGLEDVNLVWFCVNSMSSRFEGYERELIRLLSYTYEIPFVIVLTKSLDDRQGELETFINSTLPKIVTKSILAKDYKTRQGVVPAFGLQELLKMSVLEYSRMKESILKYKLEDLEQKIGIGEEEIARLTERGKGCIQKHSKKATAIGVIPIVAIPFVHGICIKMLYDLDKIFGIKTVKGFGEEIFANVVVGLIATPLMAVPLLSTAVAYGYVESVGERYLETIANVVRVTTYDELNDANLMAQRIKKELLSRKRK